MKFERDTQGNLKKTSNIKPPRHVGYQPQNTIKILFDIVKCQFLTPYPHPLDDALSAFYPGFVHTTAYKAQQWDGKHRFITRAGYFPTGLLPVVYAILKTGNNPLVSPDKSKYQVLKTLPKNTIILTKDDKSAQYYHPGFVTMYIDFVDVLEGLNEKNGTFPYSGACLNGWKKVEDTNPLAKQTLKLARDLHIKSN